MIGGDAMADASAWLGIGAGTTGSDRADDAWRRITEKPVTITIKRGSVTLDPQTGRFEYSSQQGSQEAKGGAGMSSVQKGIFFGIRGHATEADTDIQRDDRFTLDGVQLRVVSVIKQTGEVQANCEVQG
jgi:hypothetical protein